MKEQIEDKEVWKDIKGFEGLYMVSNKSRIMSLVISKKYKKKGILNGTKKNGYISFTLCKNGKPYFFQGHRLIAEAFIPNPENKPHINHINGIRCDNRLENLEWCTPSENTIHAYSLKLMAQRKRKIINLNTNVIYESCKEASLALGYSCSHIKSMILGVRTNKLNLMYYD